MQKQLETIVIGGGCFWCIDAFFRELRGVMSVVSGYAGGHTANPDYESIHGADTGHAEVVELKYEPEVISFETILDVFFAAHDPTTLNRQGHDIGSEYRSIILFTTKEQEETIRSKIAQINKASIHNNPIVTEVKKLEAFYPAEEYHQDFYNKNPLKPYCSILIGPKLQKLRKLFAPLLNTMA